MIWAPLLFAYAMAASTKTRINPLPRYGFEIKKHTIDQTV
jgi:hypothetical protein